ncbi:MAG TPA: hypothetical protein VN176_08480 [Verrucomicrobiae bacterium]|jgi:hypothetical protein|nr:hypothetical protein [Verrucomicrobiae bacterium]
MEAALRFYPYILVLAFVVLALAAGAWIRAGRKTPEQRERARRVRINAVGRITDGTVIDVNRTDENGAGEAQLLIYQYDVGGVSYEASQDITHLRHLVDLHSCKIGLPTSIKYDPANPGNSIVVSESWNGLRS